MSVQQFGCVLLISCVADLLKNVTEFQAEVKKLLEPTDEKQTIPDLEVVQKHLERGATFGIDLPEIVRLKTVNNNCR